MKIMMDLVLNHTSDVHPWFVQEKRLKALQRTLTELMRSASLADGERIVTLLATRRPQTERGRQRRAAAAAAALIAGLHARRQRRCRRPRGYPSPAEQLRRSPRRSMPAPSAARACPGLSSARSTTSTSGATRPNNWTSYLQPAGVARGRGHRRLLHVAVQRAPGRPELAQPARAPGHGPRHQHLGGARRRRPAPGLHRHALQGPHLPDAPAPRRHRHAAAACSSSPTCRTVHRYLRELAHGYGPQLAHHRRGGVQPPGRAARLRRTCSRGELNEVFVFDHIGVDCDGSKWHAKPFDPLRRSSSVIAAAAASSTAARGSATTSKTTTSCAWSAASATTALYRAQSAKAYATLLMTLEGTPYIYQGQEIGMTDLTESHLQHGRRRSTTSRRATSTRAQVAAGAAAADDAPRGGHAATATTCARRCSGTTAPTPASPASPRCRTSTPTPRP